MKWWWFSIFLAGCGASPPATVAGGPDLGMVPGEPPDLAMPAAPPDLLMMTAAPPDLAGTPNPPPGYPAGPYGNQVGSVVPNFAFPGYFAGTMTTGLASAQTYGTVSFDQARTSGAKLMLTMFAGFT
jgi:hypothetical protein